MIDIQGNARVPTNFLRAMRRYSRFRSWLFPFRVFLSITKQWSKCNLIGKPNLFLKFHLPILWEYLNEKRENGANSKINSRIYTS